VIKEALGSLGEGTKKIKERKVIKPSGQWKSEKIPVLDGGEARFFSYQGGKGFESRFDWL
jgi:hypothetical protein